MIRVELTPDELAEAVDVAGRRTLSALRRGVADRHAARSRNDNGAGELIGACGEIAAAKALQRYWPPSVKNTGKEMPDIPPDIQVRTTAYTTGCLIMHPDDPPGHLYVLVIGDIPRFRVIGYIRGHDGRKSEWWRDPTGNAPAWFVPQSALVRLGDP